MVYVKMVNDKLIAGGRIGGIRGMSPGFAIIPLPRLPPGSLRSPNFFFAHDDFFLLFPPKRSLIQGEPPSHQRCYQIMLMTLD